MPLYPRRVLPGLLLLGLGAGGAVAAEPAEVLKLAEAERPAVLEMMEEMVNIDTGTGNAEGLAEVEAILVEKLEGLGAKVSREPAAGEVAGNNIIGRLEGTGDTKIMMMVHYDTVFEPGEAKARPFRTEGGRAYGPGVADAKGGAAIILGAIKVLNELDFDGYGAITVLFNPDEEKGSLGSRDLIGELAAGQDHVLSYEPPDTDAVTIATNGINYVFLDVEGRASHAGSAPDEGRNAVYELAHQLLNLRELGDEAKKTTVNWTIVEGGSRRNIIPAEASAEGDMRYAEAGETERVIEAANGIVEGRMIPDTKVTFRLDRGRPPLASNDATRALAAQAQEVYAATGRDLGTVSMKFGTDAGYAYAPDGKGPAVLETLGIVGAKIHTPDEYADLDSIVPRLYLSAGLIMRLAEGK